MSMPAAAAVAVPGAGNSAAAAPAGPTDPAAGNSAAAAPGRAVSPKPPLEQGNAPAMRQAGRMPAAQDSAAAAPGRAVSPKPPLEQGWPTAPATAAPCTASSRIAALRGFMRESSIDFYLATRTTDIQWLTAWRDVFDDEQAHMLLVDGRLESDLGRAASPRPPQHEQAAATAPAAPEPAPASVAPAPAAQANTPPLGYLKTDTRYSAAMRVQPTASSWQINDEGTAQSAYLQSVLAKLHKQPEASQDARPGGALRVGIEADIPLNRFRALSKSLLGEHPPQVELVELADAVFKLRARKDSDEAAFMRQAQAMTEAAFQQILAFVRPGLTERRVASELEYLLRNLGADGLAFPSIVASGPNSANPHAIPGSRVLEPGDFVLFDFGARAGGYCSDMTRTVVLGKASDEQRRVYSTVLAAHNAAKAELKAGISCKAPALLVNEVFAAAGFPPLAHGLGHGVGLDIHELPVLSLKAEGTLQAGEVVTVEPGIYIPGFGGVRIEDCGQVTTSGFSCFTSVTHELIEL